MVSQLATAAAKRTSELAVQAGQKTKQLTHVVHDKVIRFSVLFIRLISVINHQRNEVVVLWWLLSLIVREDIPSIHTVCAIFALIFW